MKWCCPLALLSNPPRPPSLSPLPPVPSRPHCVPSHSEWRVGGGGGERHSGRGPRLLADSVSLTVMHGLVGVGFPINQTMIHLSVDISACILLGSLPYQNSLGYDKPASLARALSLWSICLFQGHSLHRQLHLVYERTRGRDEWGGGGRENKMI